jgi:serine/threonine protein kinase
VVVYFQSRQLARCLLQRGRYIIGSERKNEIVVDEASISAQHARLTVVSEEEVFIEDFASANGTFVDGQAAEGMTRIPLGVEVRLGSTTLSFQRAGIPVEALQYLPPDFLRARRYNLGDTVVEGQTSTIFSAEDTTLNRPVAMKVLLSTSQQNTASLLRFVREAQITAQLQHPGVLPIYELGLDEQSQLFYTTRFIEGESLTDLLDHLAAGNRPEAPTFLALIGIWQKVCDVLAFAHSRGLVHGSLSPDAVEIGRFGEVLVTNWSLATPLPAEEGEEFPVAIPAIGEPALSPYTSPEQAAGQYDAVDARTDVHALGGLLYRIITLRDPLAGEDEDALLEAALSSRVSPPVQSSKSTPLPHWPRGKLPDFPAAVAMKALSLAPEDRHASVLDLQREIVAWQEGLIQGGDLGKMWKQFTGLVGRH